MQISRRTLIAGSAGAMAAIALPKLANAAAPLQGAAPASVHRHTVGKFEVTAILDGVWAVEKPETIFGTDRKPEDVAAAGMDR
jgi:hypothetical protein